MKRQSFFALMIALVMTAAMSAQQIASPVADATARGDKAAVAKLLKEGGDVNGGGRRAHPAHESACKLGAVQGRRRPPCPS